MKIPFASYMWELCRRDNEVLFCHKAYFPTKGDAFNVIIRMLEFVCDEQIVLLSVPKNPFSLTSSRCVTCPWPMISVDNRASFSSNMAMLKHTKGNLSEKFSYICLKVVWDREKIGRKDRSIIEHWTHLLFVIFSSGWLDEGEILVFSLVLFLSVAFLCI